MQEKIVIHDCCNEEELISIGTMASGTELIINKYAVEADLLLAEGFIEPHFFAGFSGGRKNVLPGIASRYNILMNHSYRNIADKNADYGVLGKNPTHEEMTEAAKKAKLNFILNVILDDGHNIKNAVAGDMEKAHEEGGVIILSRTRLKAWLLLPGVKR